MRFCALILGFGLLLTCSMIPSGCEYLETEGPDWMKHSSPHDPAGGATASAACLFVLFAAAGAAATAAGFGAFDERK